MAQLEQRGDSMLGNHDTLWVCGGFSRCVQSREWKRLRLLGLVLVVAFAGVASVCLLVF